MRTLLLACTLLLTATAFGETYIVPMYGVVSGAWYPQVTVSNPHDHPVTLRVVHGYAMVREACVNCYSHPEITIDPRRTTQLFLSWSEDGQYQTAGAYEIETSAPVRIDAMYFGWGAAEMRQPLGTARGWLAAGEHVAFAQTGFDVRRNAVVVNPNDFAIEVAVWIAGRDENETRIAVPARETRMVALAEPLCGGEMCLPPPDYPPRPHVIYFDASAPFLGGVSSVSSSWALFSLAE